MYIIKIDNGFSEWTYKLDMGKVLMGYSIQDLIDVIVEYTGYKIIDKFCSKTNEEKIEI